MAKRRRSRNALKSVALVGTVAAGLLLVRFVEQVGPERKETDRFTVTAVFDGDTGDLAGGDRLRLLGIDTPEKDEPLYNEARSMFSKLAKGEPGRLEYGGTRRDKYGRLLGYLYVDDTLLVNKALVDSGLAYIYLFKDSDLKDEEINQILASQRNAIARRVGLWNLQYEPEGYYVAGKNSFRLHRPGCNSISDQKIENQIRFATREEGLSKGLSPCRNCHP
ncbi:MAG: thermonuclease family protein [candidate division Zixibacteria bacterium]|nr:thermonuclease family protein [candidate division Zixibacteria bacterium]